MLTVETDSGTYQYAWYEGIHFRVKNFDEWTSIVGIAGEIDRSKINRRDGVRLVVKQDRLVVRRVYWSESIAKEDFAAKQDELRRKYESEKAKQAIVKKKIEEERARELEYAREVAALSSAML